MRKLYLSETEDYDALVGFVTAAKMLIVGQKTKISILMAKKRLPMQVRSLPFRQTGMVKRLFT